MTEPEGMGALVFECWASVYNVRGPWSLWSCVFFLRDTSFILLGGRRQVNLRAFQDQKVLGKSSGLETLPVPLSDPAQPMPTLRSPGTDKHFKA